MHKRYSKWIAENVAADPRGQCKEVTEHMSVAFPELRRIRGHYVCPTEGRLPHWWLIGSDGTIIDPTKAQFTSGGAGAYEPHEGPEPTGTCLNCGEYVYGERTFCDDRCQSEFTSYIEAEVE